MNALSPKPWPSVSFFAPVYDDAATIGRVVEKATQLLEAHCPDYEIWLINDASPDNASAVIADIMAKNPKVFCHEHSKNLGYGLTIRDGIRFANRFEWVAFCDGDDQFDILDLPLLAKEVFQGADAVVTRRTSFPNGPIRTLMSRHYNGKVRRSFGVGFQDISCSLKLFKREHLQGLDFKSESPFIDAEITLRLVKAGRKVVEVGIPSYPRISGRSHSLRIRNILQVYQEMADLKRELSL